MLICILKLAIIAVGLAFAGVAVWQFFEGHPIVAALWMLCAHVAVNGVAYNIKRPE